MKTITTILSLVVSTVSQGYFGVMSSRSASRIHLLPLNANGGKFFLGGKPSPYCPPQVGDVCQAYPGNETVLVGGEAMLSLAVIVPGGQQVYVAPDGSLSYTAAHSAYKPEGSVVDGWTKTEGEVFGRLDFTGGLVACPREGKPYQVYGILPGASLSSDCLGFSALTVNYTTAGAWQY